MKTFLFLVLLIAAGLYFYHSHVGGPPRVFENPVYGEIRLTANLQGRDIEAALFVRSEDEIDCRERALRSWTKTLQTCPTCTLHPVKCQAQLPARYARLFNDEPIPSTYLSASAGNAGERDGRMVIYGLTDQEGEVACETLRSKILESYAGTAHCVKASGG